MPPNELGIPPTAPRTTDFSKLTRHFVFLAASAIICIGVFFYLFSLVSVKDVAQLMRNLDFAALALFSILSLVTSLFRMWRYKLLLNISGYNPPETPLFLVVLVRNMCSDLLPARLGSLAFVFLAVTRLGIPAAAASATFALVFVFDIAALAPLVIFFSLIEWAEYFSTAGNMVLGGLVLGSVSWAAVVLLPGALDWTKRNLPQKTLLGPQFLLKTADFLDATADEIRKIKSLGIYGRLFFLSVIIRAGKYCAMYVLLYALLAPLSYRQMDLPVGRSFFGLCAAELSASLPTSGIAGFGAYEGAWALTFHLLGFSKELAAMTGIGHHLLTQAFGYTIGLTALVLLMLPIFKRNVQEAALHTPDSRLKFYAKTIGWIVLAGAAVITVVHG